MKLIFSRFLYTRRVFFIEVYDQTKKEERILRERDKNFFKRPTKTTMNVYRLEHCEKRIFLVINNGIISQICGLTHENSRILSSSKCVEREGRKKPERTRED